MTAKPFSPTLGTPLAGILVVLLIGWSSAKCAQMSDQKLIAGADGRIEKHRKAAASVSVLDASGKPVAGAKVSIKQVRHAFLFGSNIYTWGRHKDAKAEAAYRKHFADLLNYATLAYYWPSYEPRKGQPSHERTEKVARWCKARGIATKGHPLAWNYADARWFPDDPDELRRLQMARIDDCVSRFVGLIDRWDVVNEATHFDRKQFVTRAPKHTAMWKKAGQIEFTKECFAHARKAGPKATLLINDYRVDPAYERVIEKLVDAKGKRQYDVIGIQSHMHGGAWPNRKIWDVCQRFSRFGVPLHFTETTILSGKRGWGRRASWPSTPEGEEYQAKNVARLYTMLFSHPAVEAITWWDFSDFRAWQGAPAGFLRKDMTPKPVYGELMKLIKGKWWTTTTVKTGPDGTAALRGFLGDYEVTVTVAGKQPPTNQFTLAKGRANRWVVKLKGQ